MKSLLPLYFFCLPSFLLAQLTCDDEFLLTGSAVLQGECIRMTANTTSQLGCAWFDEETDFSMPFTHTMVVNFGSNDANGADGICLVYQSNTTSTCGVSGEGIGALSIPNSFIVEFDTWQNPNLGDPVNDHTAININGDFLNTVDGPFVLGNIEDGNDHDIEFSWDPVGNSYEVYFDGALVLSGSFDIINNCFGGSNMAYWGFTSSTGGSSNEHLICPGLPPEVIADAGSSLEIPCLGAEVELDGTNSDQGSDFDYEWTTNDGNIVSGEFTLTPIVDEPGTYTLTVYNTNTLCESTSDVTITIGQIDAEVGIPPFLDCIPGEVTLDGSGSSSGDDITYVWSTNDGNIVSTNGEFATVDEVGEYTLTVIYDDGFGMCSEETTVLVEEDPNVPFAFAADAVLGCDPPIIELDGAGSSEGSMFTYEWMTSSGNIINGENSLFPLVDEAGEYVLTVTNEFTGCTDEHAVFVTGSNVAPEAIAFADDDIPCGGGSVLVEGNFSSAGDNFSYEWSTTNGNIISDEMEANIFVDQPGDYFLVVTNADNGCTDEVFVTVEELTSSASVAILDPAPLTCTTTSVMLDASPTTPNSGLTYSWSTSNGSLIGDTDQLTTTAGAIGDYLLTVTETATGCVSTSMISVVADLSEPIAEAGAAVPFGCDDISLQLDGSGSSGPDAFYTWTTQDGIILSGSASLMPTVGSAGTYEIIVTNASNGCMAIDEVVVPGDDDTPVVQIALNDTLDCVNNSLVLNAQGSSDGSDGNSYSFNWSTVDGQFESGQDGFQPIVSAAGTYTLSIVNDNNGCDNSLSVSVVQDTLHPLAVINTPEEFICGQTSLSLNGENSSQGNGFSYQWTTPNGHIISGENTLNPQVGMAGNYELLVENTANNCQSIATTTVTANLVAPELSILDADTLDCLSTLVNLQSSLAFPVMNTSYNWSTQNGNLVGGNTSQQATTNAPGVYELIVINTDNNCSDTANVVVIQDVMSPVADAGNDEILNCIVNSQTLGGSATSSGFPFTYQWTSPNAVISTVDTLNTLLSSLPGSYILEVLNQNNHCTASDTTVVTQNIQSPVAVVNTPPLLTCTDSLSLLDGSGSSGGSSLMFSWSTLDGSLAGSSTTAQTNAGQEGTYQLVVTNPLNGCTDTIFATVAQDANFPTANIAMPAVLNCTLGAFELAGTANSANGNLTFSWSTNDGNIAANANALTPTIDAPGTYVLTVEDLANNCTAQASTLVLLDTIAPLAIAGTSPPFGCNDTSLQLDATNSTAMGATYNWTTSNGQILSGATSLTPQIGTAGTYLLTVTNDGNNCTATDEIVVTSNLTLPDVNLMVNDTLDCSLTQLGINASGSSSGANFMTTWSTIDGAFLSGTDGLQPIVNTAGTYHLEIINTDNNCSNNATITVVQDTLAPIAAIQFPDTLTCLQTSLVLDGSNSSQGSQFNYEWSTSDGQITSATNIDNITVDAAGEYLLLVSNTNNGCSTEVSTNVALNNTPPVADAGMDQQLNCAVVELPLQGVNSSMGGNISYQWTTATGNILAGENTIIPTINAAGTYQLTVENLINNCTTTDEVLVTSDLSPPIVALVVNDTLDCSLAQLSIDASSSSSGANFIINWSTVDGGFLSGTDGLQPVVNTAGTYHLEITNTDNSCSENATIMVAQDITEPIAAVLFPDTLNCLQTSLILDGSNSSQGSQFNYEWSTSNGQIVSSVDQDNVMVNAAGEYLLLVTNTSNDCTIEVSTNVAINNTLPVADAGLSQELNCEVEQLLLQGNNSTSGSQITYEWSTMEGNILTGANTVNPSVNAAGQYTLLVTNTNNHCTATDEINISIDTLAPLPQIILPNLLTCIDTLVNLDATASSGNADLSFFWSNTEGNNILNANTAIASVSQSGSYTVLVENSNNACTATADIIVMANQVDPLALIAVPDTLDCNTASVILDANNSSGGTLAFEWTSLNSDPIENANTSMPTVTNFGQYLLLVTDLDNGCVAQANVEVLDNSDSPAVAIETPPSLTCDLTELSLTSFISSNVGANPTYTWTTANGNIVANGNTPSPTVDQSGTYLLTVTNIENGCSGQDDILVRADQEDPSIMILPFEQLDCANNTMNIDASSSVGANTLNFTWTSANGNILNANNSALIEVDTPGDYQLILNDIINGCADTLLTTVSQDTIAPLATIAPPGQLDCMNESILLDAQASSSGPDFQPSWITFGGQFDNGTDGLLPQVSQPGSYQLIVLNISNSCADTTQVIVTQDDALPVINFLEPDTLNCAISTLSLDANASSTGEEFTYLWTTANGQILSGANSLMPMINQPGNYTLTIENTDNDCVNSAILSVAEDVILPLADAGADFELDCGLNFMNLDGSGSSQGSIYVYQWASLSGQPITASTSLMPQISMTGSYQLTVINTVNACLATDEVSVTQDVPVATIEHTNPLCFGEVGNISFSTVIGGQPPYLYSIDGGQSYVPNNFFLNLPAGQYESIVEDSNGCSYTEVVNVVQPDSVQVIVLEPEQEINYGDSILVQVQSNYLPEDLTIIAWENAGDLSCADCLEPIAQPTETSLYRLVVATENGCRDEALLRIFVRRNFPVYIPNAFSPDGEGDNDVFYIFAKEGSINKINSFAIYDRWGNEVFVVQNAPPNDPRYGWDGKHRGKQLNSAVFVYYAEIEMADGRIEIFKGDVILMQ